MLAASRLGGLKPAPQRRKRPSFSLSAARRQMVFYALIFLYTPRKSRDFVSEKLHGQTHLKERIAKRFGSLWIRQASHFSGKLNNSLKELCQTQSSLIHSVPCWRLTRDCIQRAPGSPLSHQWQSGVRLLLGRHRDIGLSVSEGTDLSVQVMALSKYYSRDAYSTTALTVTSNFPLFLLSPLPCCDLKEIGNQVSRSENLKHECALATLSYLLLPGAPYCESFIHYIWNPIIAKPVHNEKGNH